MPKTRAAAQQYPVEIRRAKPSEGTPVPVAGKPEGILAERTARAGVETAERMQHEMALRRQPIQEIGRRHPDEIFSGVAKATDTQQAAANARAKSNQAQIKEGTIPVDAEIERKVGNTAITPEGAAQVNADIRRSGGEPGSMKVSEWNQHAKDLIAERQARIEGTIDSKKAGEIYKSKIREYASDWPQGKIDIFQQYAGLDRTATKRKLAESAAFKESNKLEVLRERNPRMTQLLELDDIEGFAYEELVKALDNATDLKGKPIDWDRYAGMTDIEKKRISAYLRTSIEGGLKNRIADSMRELGMSTSEIRQFRAAGERIPGSSSSFQDIPKGLRDAEGAQADLPSLQQTFGAEDVIGFREQKATKRMESLLSDADAQMKEIFKDSPENLAIYRDLVSPEAYGGGASPKPIKTAKTVGEELGMTKQTVANRRKRIENKMREVMTDPALKQRHPEAGSVVERRVQTDPKAKVKAEDVSIERTTKGNYRVFSGDKPAGTFPTREQAVRAKEALIGGPGKVTVSKTNKGNYRVFRGDETIGTFGSKLHADQAAVGLQRAEPVRRAVHKAATDALREIHNIARGQGRGAGRFEATDFWKDYKLPKDKGTFRGRVLKKIAKDNNKLKIGSRKFDTLWSNMLQQYLKDKKKVMAVPQTVNMVDEFKSQQQGGFGSKASKRVRRMTPEQFFERFGNKEFVSKLDEILSVDSLLTGGQ
jgi:hypothetical protein